MNNAITITIVAFVIITSLILIGRNKIITVMHWTLHILFVAFALMALSTVFMPQIYTELADTSLKTWGTYQATVDLDTNIQNVINTPQNLIRDLGNLFGNQTNTTKFDYAQATIYPGMVTGLAQIYLVLALVLSIVGIVLVIYLSYSTEGAYTAAHLKHQVHLLEKRIAQLESTAAPQIPVN